MTYYDPDARYASHLINKYGVVQLNHGFRLLPQFFVAWFRRPGDIEPEYVDYYHDLNYHFNPEKDVENYERLCAVIADTKHPEWFDYIIVGELK